MLLAEHAADNKRRANWMSTYLVAARMRAAGYDWSTLGADRATADVFVLCPDHPNGRIAPFVGLDSAGRWLKVANSGRSTVWNTGTRSQKQRVLFVGEHFGNGLLPDAVTVLLQNLHDAPLPHRDALAVLLTRDHDWPSEPTRADLHQQAADFVGLPVGDFERITTDAALGQTILGDVEWSSAGLQSWQHGPPAPDARQEPAAPRGTAEATGAHPEIATDELLDAFKAFLTSYGVTVGDEEAADVLAGVLSSQLLVMAGPSGSGKSLMAAALAGFFAPAGRRARLEASKLLAHPQEFFGYYSPLAGNRFMANRPLLDLLHLDDDGVPPLVAIEEANLSPIEGYLSPLVHGLGAPQTETVRLPLHTWPDAQPSQVDEVPVPGVLELGPYPRFLATINVDAESPAPARKVVSRACVVLFDTPSIEDALGALGSLDHPDLDEADGPAAGALGAPQGAFMRYQETGSQEYETAIWARAETLRDAIGVDVVAHRQLQKALLYIAWYIELRGDDPSDPTPDVVDAAADNALLHYVLPSLPANHFEKAIEALGSEERKGVLSTRLARLRSVADERRFGPPLDFWGALS